MVNYRKGVIPVTGYQNVMEQLVEEQFERMADSLGCCLCEECRSDIIAYALNQLPPKYVVTSTGGIYSKTYVLRSQHLTDIVTAITHGASLVRDNPRHPEKNAI